MSLNIQVVADKTEFQNTFSDTIIIPTNAAISLVKAQISLPFFVQNILRIPIITAPNRAQAMFFVMIDGIQHNISWTEFFTAYRTYPRLAALEPNIVANDFFSGSYQFFTNNHLFIEADPPAAGDGDKPTISWTMAKAISDKFDFYNATDCSIWDTNDMNLTNDPAGSKSRTLINNINTYDACGLHCGLLKEFKMNIKYVPSSMWDLAPTQTAFAAGNMTNFNEAPGGTITGSGAIAMSVGNDFVVDINGGWVRTRPQFVGGNMTWGLNLSGRGEAGDELYHSTTEAAVYSNIDFGIQLGFADDGATRTYNIIDGNSDYMAYNGAAAALFKEPNWVNKNSINKWDDGDRFWIIIQRGNIINGTNEFIFTLLQGPDAVLANAKPIYKSHKSITKTQMAPTEIHLSSANANIFHDCMHIARSDDTENQMSFLLSSTASAINAITIEPNTDDIFQGDTIMNFWSALGLWSPYNGTGLVADQNSLVVGYEGTTLNKLISWKPSWHDEDSSSTNVSYYWLGERTLERFYIYSPVGGGNSGWNVNTNWALTELPKALNVYVRNLDVKNYQGTFWGLATQNTETGLTRLVGTIPLDIPDDSNSQDIIIDYEAFNTIYRPISNPNPITINELQVEISFKDFTDDTRMTIPDINGLTRLEFNIIPHKQPIKIKNELRPFA